MYFRSDHHSETPPEVLTDCSDNVKVNASQMSGGAARTVSYLSEM